VAVALRAQVAVLVGIKKKKTAEQCVHPWPPWNGRGDECCKAKRKKHHRSNARKLASHRSTIPFFSYAFPSPSATAFESIPWQQQSKHGKSAPISPRNNCNVVKHPIDATNLKPSFSMVCVAVLLSRPHLSFFMQMARTSVEFCVTSARGLGHRSSLLKPQWFSVAWVDQNSKYCTKVDASGSSNPSWGMKFSVSADEHDLNSLQQMVLTVEVYRREPIFLREHLQGAAVVQMKEYFDKFANGEEHAGLIEETASFQLRRKKSDKAHGFVDISIRICKEEDVHAQFSGK